MPSLPRQGGNLWGPLVSHQSRKEGWPCLILYGLLKLFPRFLLLLGPELSQTGPQAWKTGLLSISQRLSG